MTRSVFWADQRAAFYKKAILLALSFFCLLPMTRPSTAANLTVEQPSFSPSTVQIGQNFTFSFSLYTAIALSHAIVDMEVRDLNGDLLLQQFATGQNLAAGQTQSYAWNGTIPSGQTLSVPFAPGTYTVSVNVFSSDWSSQYMVTTVADTFTVGAGGSGTTGGAPANLTVEQPNFSPSAVQIGQNFSFSFNLNSVVAVSNAIVDMEIRDQQGDLLLQQFESGQNFTAGQTTPYSWNGTIPTGQTLSQPFSPGVYNVTVTVYNSNWTSPYMASTNAGTIVVNAAPPGSTTVGDTALAPIPAPAGTGNTYYVSDPSNAAVNQANLALVPAGAIVFTTLQAASNATQPGDTVLVMNGTYSSPHPSSYYNAVATITNSGSPGAYITYAPYPGAHPILTTANAVMYDTLQIEASYIVIEGFEIVGSAQNVTLAYATQAAQTEEALLSQEAAAGQPASYPGGAVNDITNGNCIAAQNVTHVMILNNLIHDCSAAGIDFEKSDYTTVEANTVYNTSWWTMYDTSGIDLHQSLNSDSSTAYKNFVLDNISYNNANTQPDVSDLYADDVTPGSQPNYPTDGEGIIIDTNQQTNNGSAYLGRTLVAGNITYDNGSGGIQLYQSNHVDVINNTAYLNDSCPVSGSVCGPASITVHGSQTPVSGNYYGQIFSTSGNDINIIDNILVAPANKYVFTNTANTNYVESNNIVFTQGGSNLTNNYPPSTTDITSDPLFANSSAPQTNNFLLSASSPGIDAGIVYSNDNVSVPALIPLTVTNGMVNIGSGQ